MKNTITPSEKARKIQAPTPCVRKKSGIPIRVNVLKSVAAKDINPITRPMFAPANMKSFVPFVLFLVLSAKKPSVEIYRIPSMINHLIIAFLFYQYCQDGPLIL